MDPRVLVGILEAIVLRDDDSLRLEHGNTRERDSSRVQELLQRRGLARDWNDNCLLSGAAWELR